MTQFGKSGLTFASMWWHRKWERLPLFFTAATLIAVAIASLISLVPAFVIRNNVATIDTVEPYTGLELAGRDVYLAEGCYNCHSQMIRPLIAETQRYGEYSKAGEFVYDHPFQWGSRRIGPDLAREGGKQSSLWHVLHFNNPGEVSPGSIMPPYRHLLRDDVDFDSIPTRMKAMRAVGVPYSDAEIENAKADARQQAEEIADEVAAGGGPTGLSEKEVIALVAYLQRLGTDISKTPDDAAEEPVEVTRD
jgi:cytochrome c oxidase cbb3-type subunit I/II